VWAEKNLWVAICRPKKLARPEKIVRQIKKQKNHRLNMNYHVITFATSLAMSSYMYYSV
jgi:hypothetical protein